jgi:hypothetical protein
MADIFEKVHPIIVLLAFYPQGSLLAFVRLNKVRDEMTAAGWECTEIVAPKGSSYMHFSVHCDRTLTQQECDKFANGCTLLQMGIGPPT